MRIAGTAIQPPDPPPYLSPEARQEWDRLVPMLIASGHLRRIDGDLVGAYCQAYAEFLVASQQISREGMVVRGRPHPLYARSNVVLRRFMALSDRLGLSPLARANIRRAEAKAGAVEARNQDRKEGQSCRTAPPSTAHTRRARGSK